MPIRLEQNGRIGVITIDNGPLNILTPHLHKELFLALRQLEQNQDLSVGVLTGTGSRAFCAGDDVKSERPKLTLEQQVRRDLYPRRSDDASPEEPSYERDIMGMARQKPVVAAIRGWCIGQGLIYACHLADIRIASESARFGLPEIAYGMAGAAAIAGICRHLPRAIAMQLALTGDPIDAQEAHRAFLVNEVVADTEVVARSMYIAGRIARHPPLTLRAEMESLQRSQYLDPSSTYSLARGLDRLQRLAAPQEFSTSALAYSGTRSRTSD